MITTEEKKLAVSKDGNKYNGGQKFVWKLKGRCPNLSLSEIKKILDEERKNNLALGRE